MVLRVSCVRKAAAAEKAKGAGDVAGERTKVGAKEHEEVRARNVPLPAVEFVGLHVPQVSWVQVLQCPGS